MNLGYEGDFANTLNTLGVAKVGSDYLARQQTLKNKYNKGQLLPKAAEELSLLGQYPQYKKEYLGAMQKTSDMLTELYSSGKLDKELYDKIKGQIETSEYAAPTINSLRRSKVIG